MWPFALMNSAHWAAEPSRGEKTPFSKFGILCKLLKYFIKMMFPEWETIIYLLFFYPNKNLKSKKVKCVLTIINIRYKSELYLFWSKER